MVFLLLVQLDATPEAFVLAVGCIIDITDSAIATDVQGPSSRECFVCVCEHIPEMVVVRSFRVSTRDD